MSLEKSRFVIIFFIREPSKNRNLRFCCVCDKVGKDKNKEGGIDENDIQRMDEQISSRM